MLSPFIAGALAALPLVGTVEGEAVDGSFQLVTQEQRDRHSRAQSTVNQASSTASAVAKFVDYAWTYACQLTYPGSPVAPECGINDSCSEPGTVNWRLWVQRPDGTWEGTLTFDCFGEDEDPAAPSAAAAVITPAMVLNEIRRIGLPDPTLTTEPPGSTLVNLETRFKTTDETFTAEVTLLGRPVALRATPTRYVVDHGDGTSGSTSDSTSDTGQSDSEDVLVHTHTYATSGAVSPQVTTTWSASFSVAGGPMTQIDETITIVSPATTLDVRSSTPLLTSGG